MAEFDIHPGTRRHRILKYTKADGSPGVVETPPTWDLSEPDLATVDVDPDAMHGVISHNGAIGDLTVSSRADGDLGAGENLIIITDIFHMLAPLGAAGGESTVGAEEPIPA
jgi:hypothetical protein